MSDDERNLVIYARLAAASQAKRQLAGRDRFLILAGVAATRAGWPAIAEEARRLVQQNNPRHLIGQWDTFGDALRSEDFPVFLKQLQRICGPEQADHLLHSLRSDPTIPPEPQTDDLGTAILAMWSTADVKE
ncbi:hypothetical protein [Thalassoroseus pseudoceratinae]|uniref:hypothetical protein n=1 Tax=Thalassoroseus pseudoceratinae TaxID=2713176 RepID=UPI001421EAF6|nr:hypothetical protein [Thalassoroseus pseudoceratinae]